MGLARRFVAPVPRGAALLLAVLPLAFTGKALLLGRLYGPADLYRTAEPWASAARDAPPPANPILSDLAFANLPWRAAVREAAVHGRLPFWNRFVLAGTPLLGTAQAGVFHPATWLGLWLPVPLSFTFSCAFTIFLGLLSGYIFFADFRLGTRAALVGAVGWGFSTYVLFWTGWSVGPSTATWPLLLLGLRRIAREPGRAGLGITAAALWLSICGGHPESAFHGAAAAGVWFLWELYGARRTSIRVRAIGVAAGAGLLALLLAGPQLLPLLEIIPRSAEFRERRAALAKEGSRQSVPPGEAARRLLPDLLPFAHGIYGRSPVQTPRNDGSGMPLGYAGAVLFPLALVALAGRRRVDGKDRGAGVERGRAMFLAFAVAGAAYGASAPGLHDVTSLLPGFALALNYRLVFLAGFGLAGLAAFGAARLETDGEDGRRRLGVAAPAVAAALVAAFFLARPVFAERALPAPFLSSEFLFELVPVVLLGLLAAVGRPGVELAAAALALLVAQRSLEMRGVYPTLPASSLTPAFAGLPAGGDGSRVAGLGPNFRPNGAALYRLEDARGYESLVLDRFADTFPLWCRAQPASFNLVTDAGSPFLAYLGVRWLIGSPSDRVPEGWKETVRNATLTVFENPRALPRAFVAGRLVHEADSARRLAAMAGESDFARTAWLSTASAGGPVEESGGSATLRVREAGPDVLVDVDVEAGSPAFVATSIPDWPGWRARAGAIDVPLETVNHAFVGFRLPPGRHSVRLTYRPPAWTAGLAAAAAGLLACIVLATTARRAS